MKLMDEATAAHVPRFAFISVHDYKLPREPGRGRACCCLWEAGGGGPEGAGAVGLVFLETLF